MFVLKCFTMMELKFVKEIQMLKLIDFSVMDYIIVCIIPSVMITMLCLCCYELAVSTVVRAVLATHVNDSCCTAVQVFVQIIEDLPQLLHGLLVGLQQHGLEVHR